MLRTLHTLMILAAFTVGCQPKGSEDEGSDAKIYGGVPVKPGEPLEAFTAALTKPSGAIVCTATLVTPTVLVTAAHCLTPKNVDGGMNVVFGVETKRGLAGPVIAYVVHPKYNPANQGSVDSQYDIGLVAVASAAPGSRPIPIIDPELPLEPYLSDIVIAGFGLTDVGAKDPGILRSAHTAFAAASSSSQEVFVDGFRVTNACSGDSGGPALIWNGGQYYVLGAASYVIGMNGRLCDSGYAAYTDLRAYRNWIKEMMDRLPTEKGKVVIAVKDLPKEAMTSSPQPQSTPGNSGETISVSLPEESSTQAAKAETINSEAAQ
jgi:secreted trypsin-like serine protease